jgi:hypothetical protein
MSLEPMPYPLIPKRLKSLHLPTLTLFAERLQAVQEGRMGNRNALVKAFAPVSIILAELGHEDELCDTARMVAELSGDLGQVDMLLRLAFRNVCEIAKRPRH